MLVWSLVIAQKNKALLQLLPNTGAKESSSSSSPKKAKPEKLWLWLPQNGKTKKALALAPAKRQHQKSSGSGLGKIDLEKKTRLRLQKKIKAWTTVGHRHKVPDLLVATTDWLSQISWPLIGPPVSSGKILARLYYDIFAKNFLTGQQT